MFQVPVVFDTAAEANTMKEKLRCTGQPFFTGAEWLPSHSCLTEPQHLAVTVDGREDGSFVSLYRNSLLIGSKLLEGQRLDDDKPPAFPHQKWCLGQEWDGNSGDAPKQSDFFEGGFDEVRFWSSVRTQQHIVQFMSQALPAKLSAQTGIEQGTDKDRCTCLEAHGLPQVSKDGKQYVTYTGTNGTVHFYPGHLGTETCQAWDETIHPDCAAADGSLLQHAPSWCSAKWCWVGRKECKLPDMQETSMFKAAGGLRLWYSYLTCGYANTYDPTVGLVAYAALHSS